MKECRFRNFTRAFKEPALDGLWCCLDESIWPLVQCLPENAWEVRSSEIVSGITLYLGFNYSMYVLLLQHLRRPLNAKDLRIMQSYAHRVRSIGHFGAFARRDVNVDVYRAISLVAPSTPLFPNLRRFHWTDTRDDVFPFTRLFLGGSLITDIRIIIRGEEVSKLSLLPFIETSYPHIKKANFITDGRSGTMVNAMSDLICRWDQVEELSCGCISGQALAHLAHLSTLRSLRINLPTHFPELEMELLSSTPPPNLFSSLRLCSFSTQTLITVNHLLSQLPRLQLESISLFPVLPTPARDWQRLFDELHAKVCCSSLQRLTICEDYSVPSSSLGNFVASIKTLKPLLQFSNLITVCLEPLAVLDINNHDLEEMSKAWPRLQHLDLSPSNGHKRPHAITLAGLVPLLQNCTDLSYLGIVIDATHVEPINIGVQNLYIEEISLGESEVDDPHAVAPILHCLMPNLEEICAWNEDHMQSRPHARRYRRRWGSVTRLLAAASEAEGAIITESPSTDSLASDVSDALFWVSLLSMNWHRLILTNVLDDLKVL